MGRMGVCTWPLGQDLRCPMCHRGKSNVPLRQGIQVHCVWAKPAPTDTNLSQSQFQRAQVVAWLDTVDLFGLELRCRTSHTCDRWLT